MKFKKILFRKKNGLSHVCQTIEIDYKVDFLKWTYCTFEMSTLSKDINQSEANNGVS